tara:strand:- start:1669 stop:1905 length:237 start_codon:yes stop_codon:yes gene_type:complete
MLKDCKLACCAAVVAVVLNLLFVNVLNMLLPSGMFHALDQVKAHLEEHKTNVVGSSLLVALVVFVSVSLAPMCLNMLN